MKELHGASELPLFMVNSSELDFLTSIEHDYLPPIAFKDRPALDRWLQSHSNLGCTKIGRRDENNVVIIHGQLSIFGYKDGLSYRQIWANVNYTRYRDAIKFQIKTTEGALKTVDLYDCDHAVGQTRLAACWPDAWVNMVLIESGINRAVGAMMEKLPLNIDPDQDYIEINAECALKTFLRREGALQRADLPHYLQQARQRFIKFNRTSDILTDLHVFTMAENATNFFDHLARELGLEQIEWEETPPLIF
jgi:hypothetical protein